MNKNEQVYCTDCKRGERLIDAILKGNIIPFPCRMCYPYDPEDSRAFEIRDKYSPKKEE